MVSFARRILYCNSEVRGTAPGVWVDEIEVLNVLNSFAAERYFVGFFCQNYDSKTNIELYFVPVGGHVVTPWTSLVPVT